MANYINTRVRKSEDGRKWNVEGQNGSTFQWDVLLSYPVEREQSHRKADDAACKLAQDFSKKCRHTVTAYGANDRGMAFFNKGEYTRSNNK